MVRNFFTGLSVIFVGAFIGFLTKTILPLMITTTDFASLLLTTGVPIALFFILLVLGFMIMIGRKGRRQQ